MKNLLRSILLASFVVWMCACNGTATNPESTLPATIAADDYPAPAVEVFDTQAYPTTDINAVAATSLNVPDPSSNSAVIIGFLLKDGQPVVNATLYLAEVQEQGGFAVGSYSRSSSPRAETDTSGRFVFADIVPGKYGMIMDNFVTYVALHIPGESEEDALMFDAVAGQITDLGILDYQDLPEP